MAACAGLDPLLWWRTGDDETMEYLRVVGERMIEIDRERSERQAKFIIHELSKALEKGGKRAQGQSTSSTR